MAETAPEAKPLSYTIEADGSRLRTLLKPLEAPGGQITAVKLRPPRYEEVMNYGDPASLILMDNAAIPHNDMGIIRQYVGALLVNTAGEKLDPTILQQCDYRDAVALTNAVISFFK